MINPLDQDFGQAYDSSLNGAEQITPRQDALSSGPDTCGASASAWEPFLPPTFHGSDIKTIYKRAQEWASHGAYPNVTMGHFLLALAESENGGAALKRVGVAEIPDLERELLNATYKMTVSPRSDSVKPVFDDCVLALLNHSLGYARHDGRDTATLHDVMSALAYVIKHSDENADTIGILKKFWPKEIVADENEELLIALKQELAGQQSLIVDSLDAKLFHLQQVLANQSRDIVNPIAAELRQLQETLRQQPLHIVKPIADLLSEFDRRISALENRQTREPLQNPPEPPQDAPDAEAAPKHPWYRLNGIFFTW